MHWSCWLHGPIHLNQATKHEGKQAVGQANIKMNRAASSLEDEEQKASSPSDRRSVPFPVRHHQCDVSSVKRHVSGLSRAPVSDHHSDHHSATVFTASAASLYWFTANIYTHVTLQCQYGCSIYRSNITLHYH